jgi:hypothetical protein
MVERITKVSHPRVIISGIDYLMFVDSFADDMNNERTMRFDNGLGYRYDSSAVALQTIRKDPKLLHFLDPRVAPKFLGLHARTFKTGFRFDGSRLWPHFVYDEAPGMLAKNLGQIDPNVGSLHLGERQLRGLERLASLCRERGVLLVAIQLPYYKATVDRLDDDETLWAKTGVWREFESQAMQQRFRDLGIVFFDLARSAMSSNGIYFTDAAHPTETGMSVVISELVKDERFRQLFPLIDARKLQQDRDQALNRGDPFEVYGNNF